MKAANGNANVRLCLATIMRLRRDLLIISIWITHVGHATAGMVSLGFSGAATHSVWNFLMITSTMNA